MNSKIAILLLILLMAPSLAPAESLDSKLPDTTSVSNSRTMICGSTQVTITCTGPRDTFGTPCETTELTFRSKKSDGVESSVIVKEASKSGAHVGKFPRSASCVVGSQGEKYVEVEFIFGEVRCGSCLLYELYTERGKLITPLGKNFDLEVKRRGIDDKNLLLPSIDINQPN